VGFLPYCPPLWILFATKHKYHIGGQLFFTAQVS
jgi:hypothetical protein